MLLLIFSLGAPVQPEKLSMARAAAVQPPPSAANAVMLETLPDMTKNSETTTQPVNKEVALGPTSGDGGGDAGGAGSSGASGDSHWGDGSIFDNSGRFEADMAVHRADVLNSMDGSYGDWNMDGKGMSFDEFSRQQDAQFAREQAQQKAHAKQWVADHLGPKSPGGKCNRQMWACMGRLGQAAPAPAISAALTVHIEGQLNNEACQAAYFACLATETAAQEAKEDAAFD